jgi:hypothetical protein
MHIVERVEAIGRDANAPWKDAPKTRLATLKCL